MTTTKMVDSNAFIAEKASVEKEEEFPTSFHDCNKEIDVYELEYEVNEAIEELLRKDDEIEMLKKNAKHTRLKSLVLFIRPFIYVWEELVRDDKNTNDNLRVFPFSLMGLFCLSLFVHKSFTSKHVAWICCMFSYIIFIYSIFVAENARALETALLLVSIMFL